MTRALLAIAAAASVAVLALFLLTLTASAAQCGCPAPWEPPTVPLPTLQPWTVQTHLAYIVASH